MPDENDRYSRVHYRHMIAWPERMRREGPLLEKTLGAGPSKRVLDLGSGPGDHARFLASRGFEVVGVDSSESMIEMAMSESLPRGVRFVLGDFTKLGAIVEGTFGGAICLGNVLPHLTEEADLQGLASGLAETLEPGGRVLFQLLNYRRISLRGERALPVNVRPDPEEEDRELVHVRVMTIPDAEGRVQFYPTTLRLRPEAEEPMELIASKRVDLRAWTRDDMRRIFGEHELGEDEALGSFDGSPFDEENSRDLIWIGVRG
jgi:SAM-dependent methyltransferase